MQIEKLFIPNNTKAILWDMDGVLIDSLAWDVEVVDKLLKKYLQKNTSISPRFIKSIFAYDPQTFWQMILANIKVEEKKVLEPLVKDYEQLRQKARFKVLPGILKLLTQAKKQGIKQAVVSNNPAVDVKKILRRSGIFKQFDLVLGNDQKGLKKKPAPDTYLFAVKKFRLKPAECVVIEDSVLGVKAGKSAGCYTIGVLTGGDSRAMIKKLKPTADKIYVSFN